MSEQEPTFHDFPPHIKWLEERVENLSAENAAINKKLLLCRALLSPKEQEILDELKSLREDHHNLCERMVEAGLMYVEHGRYYDS